MSARTSSRSHLHSSPSNNHIDARIQERDELQNVNSRLALVLDSYDRDQTSSSSRITQQDLDDLKKHYEALMRKNDKEFADKMRAKNRKIQGLNKKLNELQDQLEKEEEKVEEYEGKLAKNVPLLESARRERDEARQEKEKIMHDADTDQTTSKAQIGRLKDENDKLNRKVQGLQDLLGDREEEFQNKYNDRLAKELAKAHQKCANEKESMQEMFDKKYNDMSDSLDRRIKELEDLLQRKDENIDSYQSELTDVCSERDALARKLEDERVKHERAKKDLRIAKQNHEKEINAEHAKYQDLEAEFNELKQQMQTLQSVNRDLRGEIDDLVAKCDTFEDKMGIVSPLRRKKRLRREPSVMKPIVLRSVRQTDITARGSFPLQNLMRQYTGDWKGFELQNGWHSPIKLINMELRNNIPGSKPLTIPPRVIHPSGILRVCVTENKKQDTDLVWKGVKTNKRKEQELWVFDSKGGRKLIDRIPAGHIEEDATCRVM